MREKFYICRKCGNLVELLNDSGVPMVCCGEEMQALVPNTSEGAGEKHLPFVQVDGDNLHVQIGEVIHPMIAEHYIQWIYVETENGGQLIKFMPDDIPQADVCLRDDKPIAVYAYCNIHGLWKTDIK